MENDQVLINVDENGDSNFVKFLPAESISINISDINYNNNNNNNNNNGENKGGNKDGNNNNSNIGKTISISMYSNILVMILLLL